jgi:pyruvate,orthophosphate dikinase
MTVLAIDGRGDPPVELVGGKAHGLHRMHALGLPSPPAFVITTAAFSDGLPEPVWAAVLDQLSALERRAGSTFGDPSSPLLVSVRSGAATSMPGMMDTVLNVGVPPSFGRDGWAADTRTRFEASWADAVGGPPPPDVHRQLRAAIEAVRSSWWNERAAAYRDRYGIAHHGGTAVVVQAMVFGNRDDRSGTGVVFSRDPGTGAPGLTGEWVAGAQGDELVAGLRTPRPIRSLAEAQPAVAAELARAVEALERDAGDAVEVELTVESGRLHLLQRRVAKRSARAAVRIAVDLCEAGLIDRPTAVARISSDHVRAMAGAGRLVDGGVELVAGLAASPGTAAGRAHTDVDAALAAAEAGEPVVLVRPFTSPRDVVAMLQSVAVVTEQGGSTSHAALVCREAGLPAVVGCGTGTRDLLGGRVVTVDGTSGRVYEGALATPAGGPSDAALRTLVTWAVEGAGADDLPPDHVLAPLSGTVPH